METRKREPSKWIFSRELRDSLIEESVEEDGKVRAFVITPLGTRVKRLLFVGSVTSVSNEETMTRVTLSDPTGAFYLSIFKESQFPTNRVIPENFSEGQGMIVVGRLSTFKSQDGRIFFNVNPELVKNADPSTMKYWVSRSAHIARRKSLAIREAVKSENATADNLISLGYSSEEAECAIRAIKNYPNYNYQQLLESIEGSSASSETNIEVDQLKEQVYNFIKENDKDGKGCLYEDILAYIGRVGKDQAILDQVLNTLGSAGEIYESALKRFKII
ncbi:MAG: hypothetical protein M1533_02830 [Candidatus Thermoplasmatota archaeon]|jgi:RPA family protein|nr:hypothetical protein [Candidatus Thermoplasmatota archaeon]MCL5793217.1 hypothetical protein [Candidatus Thermoplasmatota archaeon]